MASNANLRTVLREIRQHAGPPVVPSPLVPVDPALLRRTMRAAVRARRRPNWMTVNQFCATGEGGGIDPTCGGDGAGKSAVGEGFDSSKGKRSNTVSEKRARQVLADAEELEVDGELVHAGNIDEDDLDEIEAVLTQEEIEEMEERLETLKNDWIDEHLEDIDFDVAESEWSKQNGWSDSDIREKLKDALDELDDESFSEDGPSRDDLKQEVDIWYSDTRNHGYDAIREVRKKLTGADAPKGVVESVDEIWEKHTEEWERGREEWEEEQRSDARRDLERDYDDSEDRREFLRGVYDEDDPRFRRERRKNVWAKDPDRTGDMSLYFDTSKGAKYHVWSIGEKKGLGATFEGLHQIGFSDGSGSHGITGAGDAVEVFGKASASVVSLLKSKQYPVVFFTAAEESRQRLYDRLTRTVSAVLPEYSAFAYSSGGGPRTYIVAKKDQVEKLKATLAAYPNAPNLEVLANVATLRFLEPELREEWFTEEGWPDTPSRTANTSNVNHVLNCGGPGSGKPGPCPDPSLGERKYPMAPREEWYSDADYERTGSKMVMMSPDEYLSKVRPLEIDESSRDNIDDLKRTMEGRRIDPLKIYKGGKEDGRHRAVAAKELGVKQVPVIVWNISLNAKGRGQFSSQRNPWRVTIRRLAPYLLDLIPDLTKGQAEGIARSIQLGLRSDAKDQDVADMIEGYGVEPERAILIARTEMARARADTELGRLKPNERVVYVLADGACPKCVKVKRKLKERRLTAKQAEGIIPVHPHCYCRWKTVNVKSGREIVRNDANGFEQVRNDVLEFERLILNDKSCGTGKGGFQPGNTCAKGTGSKFVASDQERKRSMKLAKSKIRNAPVPSEEKVAKARAELRLAKEGKIRAGGYAGGSADDRRKQTYNLFIEFGGLEKGYVVCPHTGIKLHYSTDPELNPKGYDKLERGKIFTKCQGGGYQLPNLIPESFAANRSRNDKRVRKENSDGC